MADNLLTVFARGTAYPLKSSLADLEAYEAGDAGRFSRMVDAKGSNLRTREDAIATVQRYLADDWLWESIPDEMNAYARRAEALGVDLNTERLEE